MRLRKIWERKLTAKARDSKPDSAFALPGSRKYPIDDRSHAANALSRSSGKAARSQVKKKVCSRYPDMDSCSEEFAGFVYRAGRLCENSGWTADLKAEPVVVRQEQSDGTVKSIRVVKYRVICTNGHDRLVFKVSKGRDGHPVFTDERESLTGAAPVTGRDYQTAEYSKAGPVRKLTATGWAGEVERLIGPAEIGKIFVGLVRSGFTAS